MHLLQRSVVEDQGKDFVVANHRGYEEVVGGSRRKFHLWRLVEHNLGHHVPMCKFDLLMI